MDRSTEACPSLRAQGVILDVVEVDASVFLSALGSVQRHIHGRLVDARVRRQLTEGLQVTCLERERESGLVGH